MVTPAMKIEQRNPKELKHYKLNAKQHPEAQVKGIVESIKRFGFIQPVVVDKNDEIIIGHGRTMAAMQAGLEEVPTVKLENLTEQEVKALRLIDNRIAETGWDADLLKIDLENLDIDLKPFAVDFSAMMPEPEKEVMEDDGGQEATNELTMKWGVELGQVWQLGDHRVMCGDSTKEEDVAKLMNSEIAVLMQTDPPYGIAYVSNAKTKGQAKQHIEIENDDLDGEKLQKFLEQTIVAALPFLSKNCAFYFWHPMLTQGTFFAAAAAAADILIHRQIVWVKPSLVFGRGDYHWQHELCFYGWKKGNRPPFYGARNQTTVWQIDRETSKQHPTAKPVKIWNAAILNHTNEQEVIYEPFLGSGSQIIAAEQLGRKCYGMEISPDYVAVILQRWADFTGKTPELAEV